VNLVVTASVVPDRCVTIRTYPTSSYAYSVRRLRASTVAVTRFVRGCRSVVSVRSSDVPSACVSLTMYRSIEAPRWEAIRGNYASTTQKHLQQLIVRWDATAPELLLWHGPPGTGKTYALRALGREWRRWCDLHYIVDPEVFFGPDATYMLKTVTADVSAERRWRLLIAEDTGELLARDAKERMGQGLSRLLNLVDGLIGQGLRIMVLITTNEPLSVMHDAVVRPGRCSGPLQFQPFSAPEAGAWLANHGKPPLPGTKPRTLAELFSGRDVASNAIGFASTEAA
jgi:hypothetical protein